MTLVLLSVERTRMRTISKLWTILAIALAAAACGDDSSADGDGASECAGHEGHEGHDCAPDASVSGDGDGDGMAAAGSEAFPFVPCPDDVSFSIGMEAVGDSEAVMARLLDASPAPPEKFKNDWAVEFLDMDGNALDDVEVEMARPWMPAHLHDGTFPPVVTPMDDPGAFQIDDLNLWMRGLWEVQLTVSSASAGDDYIVFDVCIEE
jgi:hypothetical protein